MKYQPIDSQRECYSCNSFKPGECRPCNEYIWEIFKQLGHYSAKEHLEKLLLWTHGYQYRLLLGRFSMDDVRKPEVHKSWKDIKLRLNRLQNEIVYDWEDYEKDIS